MLNIKTKNDVEIVKLFALPQYYNNNVTQNDIDKLFKIDEKKAVALIYEKKYELVRDIELYKMQVDVYLKILSGYQQLDAIEVEGFKNISNELEERVERLKVRSNDLASILMKINNLKNNIYNKSGISNYTPIVNNKEDVLNFVKSLNENLLFRKIDKAYEDICEDVLEIFENKIEEKEIISLQKTKNIQGFSKFIVTELNETNKKISDSREIQEQKRVLEEHLKFLQNYKTYLESEEHFPTTVKTLHSSKPKELDDFKKLLEKNAQKNGVFAYVISGYDKDNTGHWFYLIQSNTANESNKVTSSVIYIYDSGGKTRKNFRDSLIGDKCRIKDKSVKYIENETQFQTNSGACEMFAIDGLDLIRFQIFNSLSMRSKNFIISNKGKLDPVLEIGLSEEAFGKLKSNVPMQKRIETLKKSVISLKGLPKAIYSYSKIDPKKDETIQKNKYIDKLIQKNTFNELMQEESELSIKYLEIIPEDIEPKVLQPDDKPFIFRASQKFLKTLESVEVSFEEISALFKKIVNK